MRRLLDIALALPVALITTPIVAILSLLVLIADGTPILHRDLRLGRGGRIFGLLKIRSMKRGNGAAVTAGDDPRLLSWARVFRRFRLDELPQLWQVVSGRLTLVGPRPESPRLVREGDPREALLLEHRPGLVDPAVLEFLDEESSLVGRQDPEDWYREHLRPRKLDLSLDWLSRRRIGSDLVLLLRSVLALMGRTRR